MVFQELAPTQAHKAKNRSELETELFGCSDDVDASSGIRHNEGEAAEYGVYFDDTEYDYMQHMRDLNGGNGESESYFIEAPAKKKAGNPKGKVRLEDALRETSLEDKVGEARAGIDSSIASKFLGEDILPSKNLRKGTYQDQQDVPDVLAGFQPDMDPRLREVLEALEDDAYVDNEDDVFAELAKGGDEVSLAEFEELGFNSNGNGVEEDGWESDDTAKPTHEFKGNEPSTLQETDVPMEDGQGDSNWMKEFGKFKKAESSGKDRRQCSNPEIQSSIMTGTSMTGGRPKKRKGAMTSSTGYSMTSSSLLRTEGLTLLDARFDKIEEDYAADDIDDDDGCASVFTGTSTTSSHAPSLRSDFDGIMDEFLDGYSMSGRKRIKKGAYQTGIEQLDEIRKGLGPARVGASKVR
jgi:protein LTV1